LKQIICRAAVVASAGALAAIGIAAPVWASGSDSAAEPAPANTVLMEGSGHSIHFTYPKTIVAGEELTIENRTNSKKVGPHTFSLVTEADIPKTKKQDKICFTPGHICKAVATWHGVKGNNGPPTKNPAKAGNPGWDTEGSLKKKGDSWFTGQKKNASYTAPVTVNTSTGPQKLTFMCVIHPWMHGSIEVLPPTGG
jgi:hypothetical protein